MAETEEVIYFVVNNIPGKFRSADLRNYFSQFIESGGFACFHYRHRPELRVQNGAVEARQSEAGLRPDGAPDKQSVSSSCCCVVSVRTQESDRLVRMYSGNQWIDSSGNWLARKCLIRRVRASEKPEHDSFPYKTKAEMRRHMSQSEQFTVSDLRGLPELNPPALMPSGNVGTPVTVFLQLIQSCRLPPRLIRKLGLTFPKTGSNRRYGNVPYQYYNTTVIKHAEESVFTAGGVEIKGHAHQTTPKTSQAVLDTPTTAQSTQDTPTTSKAVLDTPTTAQSTQDTPTTSQTIQDTPTYAQALDEDPPSPAVNQRSLEEESEEELSGPDDDDDRCEEWERHEALHEDVTSQERSKERLYEEEIELKWEKGGSGLVFYTDAQFWHEEEGDFDEQTADDWDVDMSVYYDKDGGDMDSRDYVRMRSEQMLRDGMASTHSRIGSFEKFTKGVGRRLMEKQGWRDGEGLGNSQVGMADALENEGQHPRCKRGFGYHGEKLNSFLPTKKPRKDFHISTVYDEPRDIDKGDELLRRHPNTSMKYRNQRTRTSTIS